MDYTVRLRELRDDHQYKQNAIAQYLYVGQHTYSDYETGKIRIPVEHLIRLAKLYNVSMDYICGITKHKIEFPTE